MVLSQEEPFSIAIAVGITIVGALSVLLPVAYFVYQHLERGKDVYHWYAYQQLEKERTA